MASLSFHSFIQKKKNKVLNDKSNSRIINSKLTIDNSYLPVRNHIPKNKYLSYNPLLLPSISDLVFFSCYQ